MSFRIDNSDGFISVELPVHQGWINVCAGDGAPWGSEIALRPEEARKLAAELVRLADEIEGK